jgi:hypothetical protein
MFSKLSVSFLYDLCKNLIKNETFDGLFGIVKIYMFNIATEGEY